MEQQRQRSHARRSGPPRAATAAWRLPEPGRFPRQAAALEAWLDSRLKAMYDSLVAEPIPEALLNSVRFTPISGCIDKSGAD